MPLVISDSSTLIHLSRIGKIDLLRTFFGEIVIPPAVWREVVEQGEDRSGAEAVKQAREAGWVTLISPTNVSLIQLLKRDLDDGEAEVIALAIEKHAELVLLDEAEGRQIAGTYNLAKTGVVGILLRAKKEGHINALREELDKLRHDGNFWIDEKLYNQVLSLVNE